MLQAEQVLHVSGAERDRVYRYQLKQKLGHNAGRQTWLADDLQITPAEPVVLKLLAFGGEVQWDDLKLFEREAQVLKQLNHPRIPKYRDYFSIDDRSLWFGLVQEYIPGVSLKESLNQGKRYTEQQVRKIAVDILKILTYLHQLNPPVLHRDIKPSNLILGEDKQVYLVDFGAVQDRAAKEGATFTVVGTYGYAPMEQFGGRAVAASDLYALGATLIHLLTGTAPADLPQDDLRIQFNDQVTLSPSFMGWIETLTEPSLKRRFSAASQALTALKSSSTRSSAQNPTSSQLAHPSPAGRISPPSGTRIEVNKSLERLQIIIPERNPQGKDGVLLLGGSMGLLMVGIFWLVANVGIVGAGMPFLVILGIVFCRIVQFYYEYTQVEFNRNSNSFRLEWHWFNHIISRSEGLVSDILYTCCHTKKNTPNVVITGSKPYSFGQGLTELECAWLAQEIQTWLNLR